MPSWIPVLVMLVALLGQFLWLPFGFALIGAALVAFLIFLELFLAGIRGRHIIAQRTSHEEQQGVRIAQYSPRKAVSDAIWIGLMAKPAEWRASASSHMVLGDGGGFDAGLDDRGGDGGIDV
jgi:hypothetical protein